MDGDRSARGKDEERPESVRQAQTRRTGSIPRATGESTHPERPEPASRPRELGSDRKADREAAGPSLRKRLGRDRGSSR